MVRRPGPHVTMLLKLNQQLHAATPRHALLKFWKPLFAAHFAPNAAFHIDLKSADAQNLCSFKLPLQLMPNLWKSKYEAGMISERFLLDNPIEHAYSDDSTVVDCPSTLIISNYPQSVVLTDGHLRVWFNPAHKIFRWEFSARAHQELFTPTAFNPPAPPHPHCTEYGVPKNLLELMLVAEAINRLSDKIDNEVNQIVASNTPAAHSVPHPATSPIGPNSAAPNAANAPSSTPSMSPLDPCALATEITSNEQSTGNAYRAMLSQFGGSQALSVDPALSAKQMQIPSPSSAIMPSTLTPNNRTDAARSLLSQVISPEEATANAINNALSWRNDQSQPLHTSEMLTNILEETFRSSLAPDNENMRQRIQRQTLAPTDHLTGQIAELGDAQDGRQSSSAIGAAAAAAASGQGGWGVDLSSSAKQSFGDALDAQLALQASTLNASLNLAGITGQKATPMRHAGNPGLSLFQSQVGALDGRKSSTNRGNRAAANMRATGNTLYREFSDVELLKRMSVKSKQEQQADVRSNGAMGINGSAVFGLTSGSQGSYSHLSGELVSKLVKDESSMVGGHGSTASITGKKSRRSSVADGREKRQKSARGGNTV
ncbi:unnamed protein product [Agarophyton chilense]